MQPTRAVPGGCIIGLFGCGALIYSIICGYGIWFAFTATDSDDHSTVILHLTIHGLIAILAGLVLIRTGWRLALRADMSDPDDPNRPKMRF
jgi:hypothetical protein